MNKISSEDAKAIMSIAGSLVIVDLVNLEEFIEMMINVDEYSSMTEIEHISYMSQMLNTIT